MKTLPNPMNFKTERGLKSAIIKANSVSVDCSVAWWYKSCEFALIHNFGWTEQNAVDFIVQHKSRISAWRR